jgi:hypothetical protein
VKAAAVSALILLNIRHSGALATDQMTHSFPRQPLPVALRESGAGVSNNLADEINDPGTTTHVSL